MMKYVVAGNFEQYRYHIEKKGYSPNEYRYVSHPDILRGLSEIEGFYIGTYLERPDIEEIKQNIAMIKSTSVIHKANSKQVLQTTAAPVFGDPLAVGYGLKPTSIMIRTKNASGNNEWQTFES